ncbi:hypothetical protein OsI_09987 [Oryza sativa Indica Group]|uniref:Uncharacterized protein n=1 Tax=Oryza sativa subsp. indica TaxID=39946 RepID=B8AND3_ORYSI|nr:hypothetical protein OsI_09987 [Oryza sativa Indica Group]
MARKEGEGLDLVAMEEELDLYSWEPVVTLAISLLDRAISYLGEDSSWAEGRNKNRFGGFSSQMFYYLQPARGRIAVELLEDLIEEIEHRRLEEDGRIPALFMNAKAKIAFKFATNDYFREEWDRLFQEFTTFRLEDLITDIEHLRLEESGKKISNKKFARSPDQYKQQARLFFLLERGVSRLRDQLPAVVEHVVSQDRELVDLEKEELHAELVGRDREKKQIVQWLVEQPAENSEIIFPFKTKKNSEIISADHIRLFAILGVAGMGKTRLAKLACQDPVVSTTFDFVVRVQICSLIISTAGAEIKRVASAGHIQEYLSVRISRHCHNGFAWSPWGTHDDTKSRTRR